MDEHWRRGHVLARDAELLAWQHPHPADPGRLAVLAAREDGRPVGILGVIPTGFCVRGERRECAWLTTWVVRADRRGSQLGLALLKRVLEEFPVVGTLGGNETTQRILGGLRFDVRAVVPRWVRAVSVPALERLLGRDAAPWAAEAAPGPAGDVVPWREELAQAWDEAWAGRFAPGLVGTWRDSPYIRRRYLEHPTFRYDVRLALARDGDVRGLAVRRLQQVAGPDVPVLRLLELLGEPEAAAALAADAVSAAAAAGAAFADFSCADPRVAEPLAAAGFARERVDVPPLPARFQPLDLADAPLTLALRVEGEPPGGPLYLTRADGDQDRPSR